jgi:hypothetical protein
VIPFGLVHSVSFSFSFSLYFLPSSSYPSFSFFVFLSHSFPAFFIQNGSLAGVLELLFINQAIFYLQERNLADIYRARCRENMATNLLKFVSLRRETQTEIHAIFSVMLTFANLQRRLPLLRLYLSHFFLLNLFLFSLGEFDIKYLPSRGERD